MRHLRILAACLIAAAPVVAAPAQDDLASKLVNDPAEPVVNGARAKLVDDSTVQGGKALRVTVPRKGANNWDSVVESEIARPVKAGDRLVLAFDARLESGAGGATSATIPFAAVQLKEAPHTSLVSGEVTVGPTWQSHQIEGKADRDYPAGALKATVQIGNARQTIDFGPIVVLNMGQ